MGAAVGAVLGGAGVVTGVMPLIAAGTVGLLGEKY